MAGYILAIDQSTAGTKAVLVDKTGTIIARADKEHRQITNQLGYVEHDPMKILENVYHVTRDVVLNSGIDKEEILSVSISNQRETAVFWSDVDGMPVYNAIVWQCARGKEICDELEKQGFAERIKSVTGLNLSPYFSAPKISWVLRHVANLDLSTLRVGTVDSWLIYNLTGGKVFATDYSNASRTQLFDLEKLEWSEEIAGYFNIPTSILPTVMDSDTIFGKTDLGGLLPTKIPICGIMGDSHGALFGQGCISSGMTKATYGTGSSVMTNIGANPITNSQNVVSSIAWGRGGKIDYVLEGNINYTGAVIKWLVDDLELISSPKEAGAIAAAANPADTTYLVPAFSGLSAPYWRPNATAVLTGMTRTTKKAEIVRAAEECIAYQIFDVLTSIEEAGDVKISTLRVDGGPTKDAFLMNFQSSIGNIKVLASNTEELSALGAAFMGGIKLGFFGETILNSIERTPYLPSMLEEVRREKLSGWNQALSMVLKKPWKAL